MQPCSADSSTPSPQGRPGAHVMMPVQARDECSPMPPRPEATGRYAMPSQRKRVQNAVRVTATLRAAIYCRVSTASQAIDGTSLESQLETCRDHCERNGWVTLPEPFVDGGVSGALASRPQLDAMVALAECGEIDVVVVSRLDRLGRSVLHLATLVQRLDELGVRVVVVSGGVDTSTPTGRLLLTILGALAEFERVLIQERTTEGLHRRAGEGVY